MTNITISLPNTELGYSSEIKVIDNDSYYLTLAAQGSEEWLQLRKNRLTMSNCLAIIGKSPYCSREAVYRQIIGEMKVDITSDMTRGTTLEPVARQWYSNHTGNKVTEVGLALWKSDLRIGASVDGLVEPNGMIEIKCPRAMYQSLLEQDRIPDSHYYQIQGCLWVLNRQWCDYVVYTDNQVCIKRVFLDPLIITEIREGFQEFLNYYDM